MTQSKTGRKRLGDIPVNDNQVRRRINCQPAAPGTDCVPALPLHPQDPAGPGSNVKCCQIGTGTPWDRNLSASRLPAINHEVMNAENLIAPQALLPERGLRLFALYVDSVAAAHARWAIRQISQRAGEPWKISSEMWNLDSLIAGESIRKMTTRDAAEADVLIVAMSSLERREGELVQWLDGVAAGRANRPASGLLVGLLGDENGRAKELDWTVKQFLRCAREMDRDFIWCWMEVEVMNDSDWLADSIAALLARKSQAQAAACWHSAAAAAVLIPVCHEPRHTFRPPVRTTATEPF